MKFFLSITALLFLSNLLAQPMTKVTYETKLKVADEAAKNGDYYNAIDWFDKAYDESKDINLQIAMADLYVLARDYRRAEQIYTRILKRDRKKEFEDLRPALASVYKSQGKYKEALVEYDLILGNAETADSTKAVVLKEKAGIDLLDKYENNLEVLIGLIPGKVNSGSAESSPAVGPDGQLYYSSFNTRKEIVMDGKQGEYEAKLFKSALNDKGEYDKAQALADNINRVGFNSGGVSFSADGRMMYFTRATLLANGLETSRIYISYFRDGGWSAASDLSALNGDFLNKHPYEGELFGKKVLFFASNRPGTEGGFDLFYSDIIGDNFGIPVSLGPVINTKDDEISPFYKDGTLYFSSNGQAGMGGFDLFYSVWNGSTWESPVNMGYQYNTSYDDMFLRFDPSGKRGFVVSNRPFKGKLKMKASETCCDDIYGFAIKELVIDLFAQVTNDLGPLEGATIEVYDLTQGGYPDTKTNPKAADFSFSLEPDRDYKVIVSKDGFYPDSVTFNTVGIIDDYSVKKTFKLNAKPEDADISVVEANQPIRLNNIYYDLDKAEILPDAEQDLSYLSDLMYDYPNMVIELGSHTDAQGENAYNQKLSQRRAESAKNWLVKQGIDEARIKPVGYGETVILNRCLNGVRCSDAEHRINRRTEFKIISGPTSIKIKKSNFDVNGKSSQNDSGSNAPVGNQTRQNNTPTTKTQITTPTQTTPSQNNTPVPSKPQTSNEVKPEVPSTPKTEEVKPESPNVPENTVPEVKKEERKSRSTKGNKPKEEKKERKRKKD